MQISYYAPGNVRLLIFLQYQSFDSIYSDFFLLEVMNVLSFFTPPSIHFHYFLSHLSSRLLLSSSLSVAIAKLIIAISYYLIIWFLDYHLFHSQITYSVYAVSPHCFAELPLFSSQLFLTRAIE